MKKIIRNANQAQCLDCNYSLGISLQPNGQVICRGCGSTNLIGTRGQAFAPLFGTDRRNPYRIWPIKTERREHRHAY